MDAQQLFKAGKLREAIDALGAVLRDRPTDLASRTFLFELLCFAGEYGRAEKQLGLLESEDKHAAMGGLLYRGALNGERTRQDMFAREAFPGGAAPPAELNGSLNGKPFRSIQDADPRLGARLEVIAAGEYLWIAWKDIASLDMNPPKNLRDTLWAPARIRTGPALRESDLGEVLVPVIAALSWQHPEGEVALGRVSEWCADENGQEAPYGQKMLLVDGEEFPILEVRHLEISGAAAAA